MLDKKSLLRSLPKVDKLIEELKTFCDCSYQELYEATSQGIDFFRKEILAGNISSLNPEDISGKVVSILKNNSDFKLKKVINATGTILHTNLGRAVFSKELLSHLSETLCGYSNLEFNLETGKRGSRYSHVEDLIAKVTGAEAALVTNNNAAAVLICLNEFGKNKEIIISRGELVEVGGSFRIPDIMELSGAKLIEIGTTNRTHLNDYIKAITEETSILLKVHTSNYHISGFTTAVPNSEIVKIAKDHNLISMEDLGSGVLIDFSKYGLKKEPTIQEALNSGMDLVTFSGDKLLGGPQCGVIIGKKELIDRLKRNQFLRAFRVCKMTLAALEYTFKQYLDEKQAINNILTLNRITESLSKVETRATLLKDKLEKVGIRCEIIPTESIIGGGSMPDATLKSLGVAIKDLNPVKLEKFFLKEETPLVGRIQNDEFVLDLKTLYEDDFDLISSMFQKFNK